ncbi:lactose regulatory protein lac9 and GAL4-like protein [Orbilia javanica]|uniref:Lactose regulatory protein lac9 and GAL4-like protein n=1 Tax=Orbilia javanica TaxID=47235 RepID=A0AAN8REV3_9PEZI
MDTHTRMASPYQVLNTPVSAGPGMEYPPDFDVRQHLQYQQQQQQQQQQLHQLQQQQQQHQHIFQSNGITPINTQVVSKAHGSSISSSQSPTTAISGGIAGPGGSHTPTTPTTSTKKPPVGACMSCRKRKVKCDNKKPCGQCVAHDRVYDCLYVQPRQRVYITQKYTKELEERVSMLEGLVKQHLPNIDINTLEGSASSPSSLSQQLSLRSGAYSGNSVTTDTTDPDLGEKTLPEETPLHCDGYEWDEKQVFNEIASVVDGMASLSVDVDKGSSYLGASSGAAVFRIARQLSKRQGSSVSESWTGLDVDSCNSSPSIQGQGFGIPRMMTSGETNGTGTPPSHVADDLIKSYFTFFHKSYPVLHEPTFLAQYKGVLPRPVDGSWPLILNMIFAIGSWTSSTTPNELDIYYYEQARHHLTADIFESGRLGMVQALTLMANYLQKRNKPNSGHIIMGIAIRMALSLGLHREFPDWNVAPLQKEIRRRVWWSLFVLDAGACVTLGRPVTFGEGTLGALNVRLPLNVQDEDFPASAAMVPTPCNEPTPYSCLIAQATFAKVAVKIHSRLLAGSLSSYEEIQPFDEMINRWAASLPTYLAVDESPSEPAWLALPRGIFWWRARDLRLILYRQLFFNLVMEGKGGKRGSVVGESKDSKLSEKTNEKVINICREVAKQSINGIHNFYKTQPHSQGGTWYVVYFIFSAVFIPLVSLLADPLEETDASGSESANAKDCKDQIDKVLWVMHAAKSVIPAAGRCIDAINSLLSPLVQYRDVAKPQEGGQEDSAMTSIQDGETTIHSNGLFNADAGHPNSRSTLPVINEHPQTQYNNGNYDFLEQANFDFWLNGGMVNSVDPSTANAPVGPFNPNVATSTYVPQQGQITWQNGDVVGSMRSSWSESYW